MSILKDFIQEAIKTSVFNIGNYFNIGDEILFGKWKNKRGLIIDLFLDPNGIPIVTIEPIPKGRKKNVVMGLFKIRKKVNVVP